MSIKNYQILCLSATIVFFESCSEHTSDITGVSYNNKKTSGFEIVDFDEQETGPGLIFIEGGTFAMGQTEEDVFSEHNNRVRRITVSSFYLDQTEMANVHYREYLHWIYNAYGESYPEVYRKALPDTLVWREKMSYNEPMVELYLRHPAYNYYPVVGVNWLQANDFCAWRTDRVNEHILIKAGILNFDPLAQDDGIWTMDTYLKNIYDGNIKGEVKSYNPRQQTRSVNISDGLFLPRYRLPTEAEWEYAALAYIGNTTGERVTDRRIYPWNGSILRTGDETYKGTMQANFVRGRGDYMGLAGALNDGADITANIHAYWPNDFGLYCMAGNVSEWVMDVYRPLTSTDAHEHNTVRGNVFLTEDLTSDGFAQKDSLGRLLWRPTTEVENLNRRNFSRSDYRNHLESELEDEVKYNTYDHPTTLAIRKNPDKKEPGSMIDDFARVYKGGSWADRAYWLSPGTRRMLDEKQASAKIGFRCAMARVGNPQKR